jgi:hypothetical protein
MAAPTAAGPMGTLSRFYPRKLAHFSPLGRVVTEFRAATFFQNVAMHVKY